MHRFLMSQLAIDQQPGAMAEAQHLRPVQHAPSRASLHASPAAAPVLTPRELQVLRLVAQGLTNRDIALRLVLSEHTVRRHLANIFRKLNLSSRTAAAAWGAHSRLV
jgi:DNA-binding NarL/FixJ family response regulator